MVLNAHHIKTVPGRKTDVRDCEWIAELLRHGLVRASFIPGLPQRELRELTRYRTALVRERAREVNRIHKTLEGANLKLGSVASDVLGKSGQAMLHALLAGITDPAVLADLALGTLRHKIPQLERALAGRFGPHQRMLLAEQLAHVDYLDATIARLNQEVPTRLAPFEALIARLDTIPGVGQLTAEALVAELGTDMGRFPSAKHLASWAGLCPGNDERAGKRRSGKTRKGNPWVRTLLIASGHATSRAKGTYLQAQYHRLAARRGTKKAAVAVGHSILVIVYHLIRDGGTYVDRSVPAVAARERQVQERRAVQRLEALGYRVQLEPLAQAA
jgi:transposase